ncbi:hypothetical protein GA0070620_3929 [Micromonospora krabiensis]|uniref:Uncharacterized protein n=1 Tax=Micromonospora krabiensis TaxID=307121 RepID=A0A1C3N764_9ACTN|nr:hypothetical protein GA0070620_3929 [Micromonospora krabiensis]
MTPGRWARLLLLVGTLFGLAAMHTLGHGAHATTAAPPHGTVGPAPASAFGPASVGWDLSVTRHSAPMTRPSGTASAHTPAVDHDPAVPAPAPRPGALDEPADLDVAASAARLLLPSGGTGHGELPGWSVCLAVLGALAVSLLVVARLLAGAAGIGELARRVGRAVRTPRAPPAPIGLRLATVAVLRR